MEAGGTVTTRHCGWSKRRAGPGLRRQDEGIERFPFSQGTSSPRKPLPGLSAAEHEHILDWLSKDKRWK